MNEKLFRKSSIDRVNSPEELNDYIRVANPGVWIILLAVVFLLLGVVIWGVFGTIETKKDTVLVVENGKAVCCISPDDLASVKVGQSVTIDTGEGTIESIGKTPFEITEDTPGYFLFLSGLKAGDFVYEAAVSLSGVEDGIYPASITVESINPIYFVIH